MRRLFFNDGEVERTVRGKRRVRRGNETV